MKAVAVVAIGFLIAGVSATAASAIDDTPPAGNDIHQVWVCKYSGTPGENEVLKPGKNPIAVDSNATVGEYFKDGQERSYVLAVVTEDNTDQGLRYTGDLECPPGEGPEPVTAEQPTVDPVCGPNNDVINLPDIVGVSYSVKSWKDNKVKVEAKADTGYELEGKSKWKFTDANEPCPSDTKFVTIIWKMNPNGTPPVFNPAQTLVDHTVTNSPELDAFDDLLTGTCVGFQVDVYKYTNEADKAAVDYLISSGVLYGPNNPTEPLIAGGLGTAWKFYQESTCGPVLTEVTPAAATVAPICGADNDTVTIPTTEGVTYSDTGWSGGERTITAAADDGYVLAEGKWSWTFTDDAVACPIEVTAVAPTVVPICAADNDTVTIPATEGVTYSDSGWSGGERTITATADEGYVLAEGKSSWTFTDEATICPIEITGVSVTVADPPICGPNNDNVSIPEVEGLTFEDSGWVDGERTITATADKGYILDGESSWKFIDEATACPVTTVEPTVVPICGPDNDTLTTPEVDGVVYTNSGWVDGELTVTATADEGYVLEGETSWTFTDVPVANCPDEPPVFSYTPTGELAFTGASTGTNGLTALAIFLMAAGTALVALRSRAAK
jgi:hypothetical protein